jgi:hypothetical protein
MILNLKKTKTMTTGTLNKFILDGMEIEIINCYTFLGTINTRDGYVNKEINRSLSSGRMAVTKLEKIMKDRDMMVATKIKIPETIIFPMVTYESDSWTVQKKDRKKIDNFELWTWRRILQTPWTERRTNLSIMEEVKPKRSLEAMILRLKLCYFGHVMRAKGSPERDIMLGQVAGYRRQGRPRTCWIDIIKEATGLCLETLKETV